MALTLSSPSGYHLDEDEEVAVFESTAAEHGGPSRPRLPEISVISPGLEPRPSIAEPVGILKPIMLPLLCFLLVLNDSTRCFEFVSSRNCQ